jgi:hypothetical protein
MSKYVELTPVQDNGSQKCRPIRGFWETSLVVGLVFLARAAAAELVLDH